MMENKTKKTYTTFEAMKHLQENHNLKFKNNRFNMRLDNNRHIEVFDKRIGTYVNPKYYSITDVFYKQKWGLEEGMI